MSKEIRWVGAVVLGAVTFLAVACGQSADTEPEDSEQGLSQESSVTKPKKDGGVGQPYDGGTITWPVEDGGVGQPYDGGTVIWPTDGGVSGDTCSMQEGSAVTFTAAQLPGLVKGRWRVCGGEYPIGGGAGIELEPANNVFYVLGEDAQGNLVRRSGKGDTGTLTFENGVVYLVSKTWGMYAIPAFRRGPRVMELNPGLVNPPLYMPE